jgi:hypothetical protein
MAESPQPPGPAAAGARGLPPAAVLCGFLLLLAAMFAVSYAVGSAAGPVAPGLHGISGAGAGQGGGDGSQDMPGMMDGGGH